MTTKEIKPEVSYPDWIIDSVELATDGKSLTLKSHERMNPLCHMTITHPSDTFVRAWYIADRMHKFERLLEEAHDVLTGKKI